MSRIAQAKKLIENALADLIEALEHGRSDALLAYLAFAGRFHKYSLRNQLLIYSQDPEATQVAGFRTWKSLGRHVRKGEHGLLVIVPMPRRRRDATADTLRGSLERIQRTAHKILETVSPESA